MTTTQLTLIEDTNEDAIADVIDIHRNNPNGTIARTSGLLTRPEAQRRLKLSRNAKHILDSLTPPVPAEGFTARNVAAYFRVTNDTIYSITTRNRAEIAAVETSPQPENGAASRYGWRAMLHIAMLLGSGASERADIIKQKLGHGPVRKTSAMSRHEQWCQGILEQALTFAEDAQECGGDDLWAALDAMSRHELQALTVALGAIVQLDVDGLRDSLEARGIAATGRATGSPSRDAIRGLASLVPENEDAETGNE